MTDTHPSLVHPAYLIVTAEAIRVALDAVLAAAKPAPPSFTQLQPEVGELSRLRARTRELVTEVARLRSVRALLGLGSFYGVRTLRAATARDLASVRPPRVSHTPAFRSQGP